MDVFVSEKVVHVLEGIDGDMVLSILVLDDRCYHVKEIIVPKVIRLVIDMVKKEMEDEEKVNIDIKSKDNEIEINYLIENFRKVDNLQVHVVDVFYEVFIIVKNNIYIHLGEDKVVEN